MSYATRLAESSKRPVFIAEFDGDTVLSLDSASGWSSAAGGADTTGIAATATCKEGTGGIVWNKTGTTLNYSGIQNTTLTPFDFDAGAYHACWLYLPSIADIASVELLVGQAVGTAFRWTIDDSVLVAGWNFLRFDINQQGTGVTYFTSGSPVVAACDTFRFLVTFDAVGNTLSGMIADWVTKHPYRFATAQPGTAPLVSTKYAWMAVPVMGTRLTKLRDGSIEVGAASFMLTDRDRTTVLDMLVDWAILGRGVTIYMGFRGDTENSDNYQPIHRGTVHAAEHKGAAWEFLLMDNLERFQVPFMESASAASPVTVSGNIVTVAMTIALSTGNATNNPTYDTLSAANGAGLLQDFFDVAAIELMRTEWKTQMCSFEFRSPEVNFLEWFFLEVCLAFGITAKITGTGLLSMSAIHVPYGADTVATLDRTNTLALMPEMKLSKELLYNQVRIDYDWDFATSKFLENYIANNAASVARYGTRQLAIKSRGHNVLLDIMAVATAYLARFAEGAPPIKLVGFMALAGIEVGDLVYADRKALPDLASNSYNTTTPYLCEVLEAGLNPATGKTAFTIATTSYRVGNYRKVGPTTLTAAYDSATAAERANYLFIADSSNYLGAANDPAHEVGPG